MGIVSSIVDSIDIQVDGRKSIVERHYDQNGNEYTRVYLAGADYNVEAGILEYAAALSAQIDAPAPIEEPQ